MYKFLSTLIFIGITLSVCGQELPVPIDYLRFVENKGQWNENIRFKAEIPNGELIVQDEFLGYVLYDADLFSKVNEHSHSHEKTESHLEDSLITTQAFKVEFVDCLKPISIHDSIHLKGNSSLPIESKRVKGVSPDRTSRNYFLGNDSSKWARNVLAYNEVLYKNIYRGIDFSFYKKEGSLKYEFLVKAGAEPKIIKLNYKGVDSVYLENYELVVSTEVGVIREQKPYAYQYIKGKKKEVKCSFELTGTEVNFKLGHYNKHYDLVIDPQLIFSTYSGSTADNWGNTACLDKEGSLYTGGTVFPYTVIDGEGAWDFTGFPATDGAFQQRFQGGLSIKNTDIGILKFDSSGTNLEYATYIGGNNSEIPTSIIANDNGELFILGITGSSNFPTSSNAYKSTFSGGTNIVPVGGYSFGNGTDIVLMRLSNDGSDLIASTYLGGSLNDGIIKNQYVLCNNYGDQLRGDINIDSLNNVYVVSSTESADFPIENGFQAVFGGGGIDGVVAKLNSDLSDLVFSSFVGGSGEDAGMSIVRDSLNNVIIAGGTTSSDFVQLDTLVGFDKYGKGDGFVMKIENDGDSILHSLKLGTEEFEQIYFVQMDEDEDVYVLGQTKGGYPVSEDVYKIDSTGIVIHKFNSGFDTSIFSTTIGDSLSSGSIVPNFSPTAFLVNDCENLFVAGWGGAVNQGRTVLEDNGSSRWDDYNGGYTYGLPITENAFQNTTDGSDFYMAVIRKDAESLLYATYFGGDVTAEHVDGGTSRFDKQGIVYQSVCAGCGGNNDFPLYPEVDDDPATYPKNNLSGSCNNGVFKYDLAYLKADYTAELICDSMLVKFENLTVGGVDFYWDFGDGKDTITYEAVDIQHRYETEGVYTVKLIATDLTTCIGKDSSIQQIVVEQPLESKSYKDTICQGDSLKLVIDDIDPTYKYSWEPTESLEYPEDASPIAFPDTTTIYTVDIETIRGCAKTDTFELAITQMLDSIKYELIGSCHALPTIGFHSLYSQVPEIKYEWDFGDGNTSNKPSPAHQYREEGYYKVKLRVENKYCYFEDEETVFVQPIYIPNVFTPNGDGKNETFEVTGIEGTGDWKVEIYNRWGKDVFTDEVYENQWDGHDLSDGTYYYLVTAPDKTTCKGWVHIVR